MQVYFLDPGIEKRHCAELEALHFRLGNAAMVSSLREEIGARMGADSIVQSKLLYSGTHSGDCIPLRLMDRLSEELSLLRQRKDLSVEARNFLDCFQELVRVALREQNPIVF